MSQSIEGLAKIAIVSIPGQLIETNGTVDTIKGLPGSSNAWGPNPMSF